MKRTLTIAALCAALLLTGCAKQEVTVTGSTVAVEQAGFSLNFPEGWEILNAEQTYDSMFYSYYYEIFGSVDEMKAALDEGGQTYYVQATSADESCICIVSSLDMTPAEGEEEVPLEDYARSVHDTAIFEYLASGFKTNDESSFSLRNYGGQPGYLSRFELLTEEDTEPLMGFAEFMFQEDMELYSVQISYFSMNSKDEALALLDNMTAI